MKYDVITSGYVSLDRIIKTKTPVRYGYTSIIENSGNARIYYGGCSTNIAYLMSKLGLNTLPLIRVGELDYRETGFYDYLKDGGVCLDAMEVIPDETTSNCYLIADSDNNHITIFYPGAMDKKYAGNMKDEFFEQARIGILTVGSYEDNLLFYKKCKAHNVPLVFGMKCDFDAFTEDFFKEVLLYSKIIFTNLGERKEIERILGLNTITDLFHKGNAEIIITTLGKRGSEYFHKTEECIVTHSIAAAEFGPIVDTTGSGDAYMAGFLYGYLKGLPIIDCCKHGSVLSSFIIETVGCTTNAPSRQQFEERYERFVKEEWRQS